MLVPPIVASSGRKPIRSRSRRRRARRSMRACMSARRRSSNGASAAIVSSALAVSTSRYSSSTPARRRSWPTVSTRAPLAFRATASGVGCARHDALAARAAQIQAVILNARNEPCCHADRAERVEGSVLRVSRGDADNGRARRRTCFGAAVARELARRPRRQCTDTATSASAQRRCAWLSDLSAGRSTPSREQGWRGASRT